MCVCVCVLGGGGSLQILPEVIYTCFAQEGQDIGARLAVAFTDKVTTELSCLTKTILCCVTI